LSVAIAFCGDSKVVLLDEPTSGMVSEWFVCSRQHFAHQHFLTRPVGTGPLFKTFHLEWYVHVGVRLESPKPEVIFLTPNYLLAPRSYSAVPERSVHHLDNALYGTFATFLNVYEVMSLMLRRKL
jgi:hypothetical protein